MDKQHALRLADESDSYDFIGWDAVLAELRRLHTQNQEWERKAETWISSPEAAKRLHGYAELAQQVNKLETVNQELVEALKQAEESLGAFVSNHGWSARDMNIFDNISAILAKHKEQ